jgi:hypothetical protein
MGAQSYSPRPGAQASNWNDGTIEGLQLPLERVLVNVGYLLNDTRSFPSEAMERLDIIHQEAAKLYEAVTRLTHGALVGEVEA